MSTTTTTSEKVPSTTKDQQQEHHDTTINPKKDHSPAAAAARAMSHTGAWQPRLDRRQSWDAQEYKHDQHRQQYMGEPKGEGFSEV